MSQIAALAAYATLFVLLLACAIIDIKSRIVPNKLVAAMVFAWLAWRTVLLAESPGSIAGTLLLLLSAVALCAGLVAFSAVYERLRKKESIGGGDIKLFSAICLFAGLRCTLSILFVACVISLVYGFALRNSKRPIPMVPCIACASISVMLLL